MRYINLILISLVLTFGQSFAQNRQMDTAKVNKGVDFDSLGTQSVTGWDHGFIFARGSAGVYYSYRNGIVRLDSAGTSVTGDTTINISPGTRDTIKVDTTVIATIADLDAVDAWWGGGIDGSITPTADTTLTRDMHAINLTVNPGIDIYTAGFRIFGTGRLRLYGTLNDTGAAGAAGGDAPANTTNSTVGASGSDGGATTAKSDQYLTRGASATAGPAGGDGSDAGVRAGTNGGAGSTVTDCIGSNGVAGGNGGGAGAQTGGVGGAAGSCTAPSAISGKRLDFITMYMDRAFTTATTALTDFVKFVRYAAGSGSGGGGARGISGTSGAGYCIGGHGVGGSPGQPGGKVWVAFHTIEGNGTITVKGGKGGPGGRGANASGGTTANESGHGGGAGGPGNGGLIDLFYHNYTDSLTLNYAGGDIGLGGAPGTATGTGAVQGTAGQNSPSAGNPGVLYKKKL